VPKPEEDYRFYATGDLNGKRIDDFVSHRFCLERLELSADMLPTEPGDFVNWALPGGTGIVFRTNRQATAVERIAELDNLT
jgi:hypothetical protein